MSHVLCLHHLRQTERQFPELRLGHGSVSQPTIYRPERGYISFWSVPRTLLSVLRPRVVEGESLPIDTVTGAATEPGLALGRVVDHHVDRRTAHRDGTGRVLKEMLHRLARDLS